MASRYDDLDASRELEQSVYADLKKALEPRGCKVIHHGSGGVHAPGGKPDIEIHGPKKAFLLHVEVTKRKGSAADGEFPAITEHLEKSIKAGGFKSYGCLYLSPATSPRMSANIYSRYNQVAEGKGAPGRIIPLDFATFDDMVTRLWSASPDLYPASRLADLLKNWKRVVDDARGRLVVAETLFTEDSGLLVAVTERIRERDTLSEQQLRKALLKLEDLLRDRGVTGNEANRTLVNLTFLRLYEEKREREDGEANRFTEKGFREFIDAASKADKKTYGSRQVQRLLVEIALDEDIQAAGLLGGGKEADRLHPSVTDEFILDRVLRDVFDKHAFHSFSLDVLGVVFETLARRGEKDTRVGQFFTPQAVVSFCADLVDLRAEDKVLDPAVGTARFLIAAMDRMLAKAAALGDKQKTAEKSIRQTQLLGSDIDGWVATIAKMNMYIHGDGKSTMVNANGLVLGDRPKFGKLYPKGISQKIDVVLTNPPLGTTSYLVARDHWMDGVSPTPDGHLQADFFRNLGVVPLTTPETAQSRSLRQATKRIETWQEKIDSIATLPSGAERDKALARAKKNFATAKANLIAAASATPGPLPPASPLGERMKGGALFVGAISNYLKPVRLENEVVEWRGGRAAIIVDEAILNTPDYAEVRAFIRHKFFIKAVISLGREAFQYLAHTDAKTSILYLIRKEDENVAQCEPVFYAHAEKVGYSSTGKWIGSDLDSIAERYSLFRCAVRKGYKGHFYKQSDALKNVANIEGYRSEWFAAALPEDSWSRLDFYGARYHGLVQRLRDGGMDLVTLGDLIEPRERTSPPPSVDDVYEFASIERNIASIASKGRVQTSYSPQSLWMIKEGDIVVSGIDVVHGAVAIAGREIDGLVMSKEMYAFRPKKGVLPEYAALLLRTDLTRLLIHGKVTGTSNRTRINSAVDLLDIPVPRVPPKNAQSSIAQTFSKAQKHRESFDQIFEAAKKETAGIWGISVAFADNDGSDSPDDGDSEGSKSF